MSSDVTSEEMDAAGVEAKRVKVFTFITDFHAAYEHSDLTKSPEVLREWLDKLFELYTELRLVEDTQVRAKLTHTYSARIDNGSRGSFLGGIKKG